jgi:glutathione S-transferase
MSELILHQYPGSPFSEKIRLILGSKGLAWRAVRIPAVMPKPDVIALTGGYRKTPILQIGNHVYCDTSLIARVLEHRTPDPTLYSNPEAEILAEWADTSLFLTAAVLARRPSKLDVVMQLMEPDELAKFRDDRVAMWQGARRPLPSYATARSRFPASAARVRALVDRSDFVCGEHPSIADFSIYHCLWFLRMLCPEYLEPHAAIRRWMERVERIGHGTSEAMTSAEALSVCASAPKRHPDVLQPEPDPSGILPGSRIRVVADDYGCDPVEGELVASGTNQIALRRVDDRAGEVIVHFPRIGFEISTVDAKP